MSTKTIVVGFRKKDPLKNIKLINGVNNVRPMEKGYLVDVEEGSDCAIICNKIEKSGGIILAGRN
ncbi:MAG: hypothetical protein WC349_03710 [Patescibacteria group bacterium]|jgi:hypothetical protein